MKTILINASPKSKFSASSYFLDLLRLSIRGDIISEKLRCRGDFQRILEKLPDADTIVFYLPLYVDGVPSHVLFFLKEMENFCKHNYIRLNVYCVANNGFIEGKQNEPLMQVFRNFCAENELNWCGGIGIGGGVMLRITRILFAVNAVIFGFNILLNGIQNGSLLTGDIVRGFVTGMVILVFLNLGVWMNIFRMSRVINRENKFHFGENYTRILLPSFVFVLIADLFFTIISIISGGIFRGWLSKKE